MSENRPRVRGALLTLLIVAGLIVWWVNSLPNEDPLWFLRSFTAQADYITVYREGEVHMFFPDDQGYDPIMTAFAEGVAQWRGYENGVGMSDATLEKLRNEGRMLELHYDSPVVVHTRHLYPEARNFFVPLSGTHARWQRVFAGLTDKPRIGVLNMQEEDFETLLAAVDEALQP